MANLVFKFNWEHRPYPYNFAQGKQQFMLPFASGIPNLTPDISEVQGAGTAARKNIGIGTGEVFEFLTTGLGGYGYGTKVPALYDTLESVPGVCGFFACTGAGWPAPFSQFGNVISSARGGSDSLLIFPYAAGARPNAMGVRTKYSTYTVDQTIYTSKNPVIANTANTDTSGKLVTVDASGELRSKGFTVDSNGVFKAASPIARLFADSLELNDDAAKQSITFEKLDVGDYLIQGSLGFAQEGWYIEMPKDANGNVIVAVAYEQLENGDISVKTYKKKFDIESASIVPDYTKPIDIPETRWIDIRLHQEPEPDPDPENESVYGETPMDFQPTNLSQAVAAALEGVDPPEINEESI
ncbi:phage tail protein [Acinetobacter sp. ABJ_C3_5]|uniref:phage tail fiber protein n=1 Tax=Acinetobacter courvalinii TaxID=280147 RepID=UPI0037C5DD58